MPESREVYTICDSESITEFYFSERVGKWIVCEIGSWKKAMNLVDALAIVSLSGDRDADDGLNQCCLGTNLEDPQGLWLVSKADLMGLEETYGDDLQVFTIYNKAGEISEPDEENVKD